MVLVACLHHYVVEKYHEQVLPVSDLVGGDVGFKEVEFFEGERHEGEGERGDDHVNDALGTFVL